ncbi:Uncharacterized protein SCG7086_BG_00040 [Chlamydiales bacterium SCGC AG-110-P3]|nr:Uncharacterized protein SCG7086_BG_00040 [Chlamydiales bacterium SCGC AG-110-P3]
MDRASTEPRDSTIERLRVSPRLRIILMTSGILNVVMLGYISFGVIRNRDHAPVCVHVDASKEVAPEDALLGSSTNAEMVADFRYMSLDQLVSRLVDTRLVEDGYTQRDLALACLVAFHQFDLPKALLGQPQPSQQRQIVIGGQDGVPSVAIIVYPALNEDQFAAIARFANNERWPLTSLGLFRRLQLDTDKDDPTLAEAFYLTREFLAIEVLFNRKVHPPEKTKLLKLALSGDWSTLSRFCRLQQRQQDYSAARRQALLLDYLGNGVPVAAELLVETEAAFTAKKLDDMTVVRVLELLESPVSAAMEFAVDILTSPRGDIVWEAAAQALYRLSGDTPPEMMDHAAVVQQFAPGYAEAVAALAMGVKDEFDGDQQDKEVIHTVKRGDSLWKISREYKVKIDEIKKINNLHSDFLKPGCRLVIRSAAG